MKPIKAGCTALITGAEDPKFNYLIGSCVTVISDITAEPEYIQFCIESNRSIRGRWVVECKGEEYGCHQKYLLRIDDPDLEEDTETETTLDLDVEVDA